MNHLEIAPHLDLPPNCPFSAGFTSHYCCRYCGTHLAEQRHVTDTGENYTISGQNIASFDGDYYWCYDPGNLCTVTNVWCSSCSTVVGRKLITIWLFIFG